MQLLGFGRRADRFVVGKDLRSLVVAAAVAVEAVQKEQESRSAERPAAVVGDAVGFAQQKVAVVGDVVGFATRKVVEADTHALKAVPVADSLAAEGPVDKSLVEAGTSAARTVEPGSGNAADIVAERPWSPRGGTRSPVSP